jgi:nucleoside-diphosphate-sugar epimerase
LLDSTRMLELGWRPAKEFEEGLVNTYQWFLENAAN